VVVAFALIVSAFLINRARPRVETDQPSATLVRASGKCAECHTRQQYAVVHEYEMSRHAQKGINCLDCHQPANAQAKQEHHGFTIATRLTAGNCRSCHEPVYQEFLHSRHAAVSWAAVFGEKGLKPEQVEFAERFQPGYARRPPHPFVALEGPSAMTSGCANCHSIGKPNDDGTIGTCTSCHTRHTSSVAVARLPTTCGQCHMGPDHSQLEIYEESKHGLMFHAQERQLNLDARPGSLTTRDMFVPTCATCHMSGLNGQKVTHDPSDRLSYYLADPISRPRPNKAHAQEAMKTMCTQCHTRPLIDRDVDECESAAGYRPDDRVEKGRRAHHAAVLPAYRLRLFRSVALRRPDVEARRLHGRRRLRAVARQLSDARANGGDARDGRRDAAAAWAAVTERIGWRPGRVIINSGSSCSCC